MSSSGERKTRVREDDWGKANRGGPDKVNEDKCIEELRKEVKLRYKGESGFQKAEEEKVRRDNRKRISNSLHGVRIKTKLKGKGSQDEKQ